jgi:colanic acid/amylovoran biosynthesis glycosyltransferase
MKTIAYLINQYPKVSHSFIRREIAALEAEGVMIERFAIRSCESELVDEADKQELKRTRIVLEDGAKGLFVGLFYAVSAQPLGFLRALGLSFQLSKTSDRSIFHHLVYFAEACVLLRWCRQAQVAHVHAHFGTNSTTVAMLCRSMGGPSYSFTVHGPEEFDKVREISLSEKIKRADFVVAISSFGKSQLYRWCPLEQWSKIHMVRCGVDQEFLTQPITTPPLAPRLVCVGRLCEQKGHLLLLEAVGQLALSGVEFELALVGDGPLRAEVEAAIDRHNLRRQVKILGWASSAEVRQQILAARAMVLPSFAEGLPVVIMEALALGRPVISTYIAGIPELVESGISGWLVPPASIEALTAVLQAVLQCPVEVLEQMGKAGSERVLQSHNVSTEVKKLAALLQFSAADQPAKLDASMVGIGVDAFGNNEA